LFNANSQTTGQSNSRPVPKPSGYVVSGVVPDMVSDVVSGVVPDVVTDVALNNLWITQATSRLPDKGVDFGLCSTGPNEPWDERARNGAR
jgi:hypothetical protein